MAKKKIGYGDFYCWNCGDRIEKGLDNCPVCKAAYEREDKYGNAQALGAGGIGWFDSINHPTFKIYRGKIKKAALVWTIGISIIIPGALLISGQIKLDKMGIINILFVIGVFALFGILFSKAGRNKPNWEGVVEDKTITNEVRTKKDSEGNRYKERYTVYKIIIRRQDGKIYELKNIDTSFNYNYYRIGDYVRFHGNKYLKCLEKYDKSLDPYLFCVGCGAKRDARDNFCGRCGTILIKVQS